MTSQVNMNIKTLYQIEYASKIMNIKRTALIKQLLDIFISDCGKYIKLNTNVRYQPQDKTENWKHFHLYLSEAEYERYTDLRKFCKMSLSLIIAVCVKKYLGTLLHSENNGKHKKINMDNYTAIVFSAYCLLHEKKDSLNKFSIYWGYPENIPEETRV